MYIYIIYTHVITCHFPFVPWGETDQAGAEERSRWRGGRCSTETLWKWGTVCPTNGCFMHQIPCLATNMPIDKKQISNQWVVLFIILLFDGDKLRYRTIFWNKQFLQTQLGVTSSVTLKIYRAQNGWVDFGWLCYHIKLSFLFPAVGMFLVVSPVFFSCHNWQWLNHWPLAGLTSPSNLREACFSLRWMESAVDCALDAVNVCDTTCFYRCFFPRLVTVLAKKGEPLVVSTQMCAVNWCKWLCKWY